MAHDRGAALPAEKGRDLVRLFYALIPAEREKQGIERWQEHLRTAAESGRFPPPENLHMTLQFLGDVPVERCAALKAILRTAAQNTPPFFMLLDTYGWLPGKGQERLWYLTGACPEAAALAGTLGTRLMKHGFSLEEREFLPHITLGRRCRLKSEVAPAAAESVTLRVQQLWLLESRQIHGSVVYVPVFSAPLDV